MATVWHAQLIIHKRESARSDNLFSHWRADLYS